MLKSLIDEILVTEEEIESIVTRLAREISRDYADKIWCLFLFLKVQLCLQSTWQRNWIQFAKWNL